MNVLIAVAMFCGAVLFVVAWVVGFAVDVVAERARST